MDSVDKKRIPKLKVKRLLSLTLVFFMLVGMTLSNAVTIPNLPSPYQYTYTGGGNDGYQINFTYNGDKDHSKARKFDISNSFAAFCGDLKHGITTSNNAYRMVPLEFIPETLKDLDLSSADTLKVRAILYNVLIANGNGLDQFDAAKLTAAFNGSTLKNSLGAIEGTLSPESVITGIQAAIWSLVGTNVSIENGTTQDYEHKDEYLGVPYGHKHWHRFPGERNANRIFQYLKDLAPMAEKVDQASAQLRIGDIESYADGTTNATVKVFYTLTGKNYDQTPIAWTISGIPAGAVRSVEDANLTVSYTHLR
ncbi:MAG: Cys-Gln thioester bond-forming surface protein, partial [Clostridia bacterium]|nr:Cys-Gln thioester bond-forming surface protein [Clostridia bacterium]